MVNFSPPQNVFDFVLKTNMPSWSHVQNDSGNKLLLTITEMTCQPTIALNE